MSYKDQFIDIYNQYVKREGASKLLAYLESTDFFTAPASTKFHLAHEMGLCEHSLNVYYRLKDLVKNEKSDWANKLVTKPLLSLPFCTMSARPKCMLWTIATKSNQTAVG